MNKVFTNDCSDVHKETVSTTKIEVNYKLMLFNINKSENFYPNNYQITYACIQLEIIIIKIIIIIIVAKIKVTLSHKCCRGSVHKSLSQVGHWSNVTYTAAAAEQLLIFSRH